MYGVGCGRYNRPAVWDAFGANERLGSRREESGQGNLLRRGSRKQMFLRTIVLLGLTAVWLMSEEKYSGPMPPKPDVLYLMHANNLVETEAGQARQENHKNDTTYVVSGASSPARTPLAEPVFIVDARQIAPEHLELYKLEVKNGNREVSISPKGRRTGVRLYLTVTKLSGRLYKIEASTPLENGQYAISPSDGNSVFCFEVY
jgi:hypothetical protein